MITRLDVKGAEQTAIHLAHAKKQKMLGIGGRGMSDKGTLKIGEFHPAARSAMAYVKTYGLKYMEPFASCAIEGNRHAEICLETLERVFSGEPVSDRYLLGLAWTIKEMEGGF